jgi:hypothetical protein
MGRPDTDEQGRAKAAGAARLRTAPTFCSEACVHERVRTDPPTCGRSSSVTAAPASSGLNLRAAGQRWRRQQPAPWRARGGMAPGAAALEADHIVPVADGGGECGLENYRLLCRACHVSVTAAWRRARVDRRHDAQAVQVA